MEAGIGEGRFMTWVEDRGAGRCAVFEGLGTTRAAGRQLDLQNWSWVSEQWGVVPRSRVAAPQVTEAMCEEGQGSPGSLG